MGKRTKRMDVDDDPIAVTEEEFDVMTILDDGKIDLREAKGLLQSRTIWINVVALIAFIIQSHYGYMIDESLQMQALTVINIFLRYITKSPVRWGAAIDKEES